MPDGTPRFKALGANEGKEIKHFMVTINTQCYEPTQELMGLGDMASSERGFRDRRALFLEEDHILSELM